MAAANSCTTCASNGLIGPTLTNVWPLRIPYNAPITSSCKPNTGETTTAATLLKLIVFWLQLPMS
ncbi:MAG: hypothetical protein KatS3mg105_4395 [Gemmatales bacterium]|nr:MAG: hypothetical protein KatS3mg105_4395 [Gemmatales bacterium]